MLSFPLFLQAIANNSGVEGAIVVGELMKNESSDIGYNAQNAEYVNMIEAGNFVFSFSSSHTCFSCLPGIDILSCRYNGPNEGM